MHSPRRIDRRPSFAAGLVALCLFGAGRLAHAQPRWDVGVQAGVAERITTSRSAEASAPWPGPRGEVQGHVALLPMLRVGAYAGHDVSPARGRSAREITGAGLHVRFVPPLLTPPWRAWLFAGVGYARAYQPSYARPDEAVSFVDGAGGGFVEAPFGIGVGVRFRPPWTLTAELGGHVGGFFAGRLYHPLGCGCTADEDSFAVTLSVGVSFEP